LRDLPAAVLAVDEDHAKGAAPDPLRAKRITAFALTADVIWNSLIGWSSR